MQPVIKAIIAASAAGLLIIGINGIINKGSDEETTSFGGGSSGFATLDQSGGVPVDTLPNTTNYNINVESPDFPSIDPAATTSVTSTQTKKESKSSPYYSTKQQTQSTLDAVDLSKTTASDANRFATDGSGAYIDRYAQQSISKSEADKRAFFAPAPTSEAQTKKESKKEPAPNYFGSSGCGVNQSCM